MLLGIALHAAMSFGPPLGGPPHDVNISPWFGTFSSVVHGFRLQLFFLVSGFFTMMLWRKRSALGLTRQRTVRILVPCLLGVYMLSPMNGWVYPWAERVNKRASVKRTLQRQEWQRPRHRNAAIRNCPLLS